MSGIFGLIHLDKRPVSPETIKQMGMRLSHLGQDDFGVWTGDHVGMGHVMLHTTPQSLNEKIPLNDRLGQLTLTSNARIDNREKLCQQFNIRRSDRNKIPDSALILKAYEKWGEDCPDHLAGDFVFALWDQAKQTLFCVTDHMASTSLHYYRDETLFAFASEAKSILALQQVRKILNKEKLAESMLIGVKPNHYSTFFKNINLIPAATVMRITCDEISHHSYWEPEIQPLLRYQNDDDYYEHFQELFFNVISGYTRSAFPVGVLLSGGLDSSSIACTASKILKRESKQLVAISSVLPENWTGSEKDEKEFIEIVRHQETLDLNYVVPPNLSVFDGMDMLFRQAERPITSYRDYLYTALYEKATQKGVRILLDGCGGELGATRNAREYLAEMLLGFHWIRLWKEVHTLSKTRNRSRVKIMLHDVLMLSAPEWIKRPYLQYRHAGKGKFPTIIAESFAEQMGLGHIARHNNASKRIPAYTHFQKNQLIAILEQRFPKIALGEARNLQIAYPFYNRHLVDFYLSLPTRFYTSNGWTRLLMRKSMEGVLPERIQWRTSKAPFSPDYYLRLKKSSKHAWQILNSVSADDPVHEFINVELIRETLRQLDAQPSWHPGKSGDPAKLIVQLGAHLICFLQWFEASVP